MRSRSAQVRGGGVAAAVVARRLRALGWRVRAEPSRSGGGDWWVTLSRSAAALVCDACGVDADALSSGFALRGRVVAWGSAPVYVDAPAISLPLAALRAIASRAAAGEAAGGDAPDDALRLDAAGRAQARWSITTGERVALHAEVELRRSLRCAVVETLRNEWIYVTPVARDRAAVQVVCLDPGPEIDDAFESAVRDTRVLRDALGGRASEVRSAAAAARMGPRPGEHGAVRIGDAAMSFDPLAGCGVENAVRGAVLAAACAEAAAAGEDERAAWDHYDRRLSLSFDVHVGELVAAYERARLGGGWHRELRALREARRARAEQPWRYSLVQGRLVARREEGSVAAEPPVSGHAASDDPVARASSG